MSLVKAIIIDDEVHCLKTLSMQLARYCPTIHVMAECGSAEEGISAIEKFSPDVIFLDVEMPRMNGFEMLQALHSINFDIIFTTGYDVYAIKAFRFSALDYLLKPIDKDDLIKATLKTSTRQGNSITDQLEIFLQKLGQKKSKIPKIALPTFQGYELVALDLIIRCEAENTYTNVFIKDRKPLLISRTLKDMEEILEGIQFLRIHQSHLINLNEIIRYQRADGGSVVMSDGSNLAISRMKKEVLLKQFNSDS